ncbi:MAG: IS66 family transposase [bacterium]|nr:IS66 family transposase [bacterium]
MGKDELKQLSKNDLVRLVLSMQERLEALERKVARGRKDSSTSSKPPSSDIVKPPKARPTKGKKRKIGGQPGHERHEQTPIPPEDVDSHHEYSLVVCPCCNGSLRGSRREPRMRQQVDLVGRSVRVVERVFFASWCAHCRSHYYPELPSGLASGYFAPRMKALVAYFKGACHMTYSTIQKFLADVYRIPVSTGHLTNVVLDVGVALGVPYEELLAVLPDAPVLNVDETGHKDSGKKYWTWCFRAPDYAVFKIHPSRGACVLKEVLGEAFGGVLGADYYSAYRSYMGDDVLVQFCMAHLIRDVRYLTTLPDKVTKNYGRRVLEALKALFKIHHRREKMSPAHFLVRMEKAKEHLIKKALGAPPRKEAQNLAKRFKDHAASYFRFITMPGVEPTNNAAEQVIRHVVIDRRITQGTRGANGRRWSERIWTTMATCAAQGRSAFQLICQAIEAHVHGAAPPSLLPA